MNIRNIALAAAMIGGIAGQANADEYIYSSWLPEVAAENRVGVVPFIENVGKETDGRVSFKFFGQGQLVGQVETLASLRDGVIDAGSVLAPITPGELPYTAAIADMQAFNLSALAATAAYHELILLSCPECQAEYEKNNVVILGGPSLATSYLMCTNELNSVADLKGLRVRGSQRYLIDGSQALGATAVNVPFPELVPAMQRKQIDCVIGSPAWLTQFGLIDIVKSIVITDNFGVIVNVGHMTMNRDSWARISDDDKKIVLRRVTDLIAYPTFEQVAAGPKGLEAGKEAGIGIVDLGTEYSDLWSNFRAGERSTIVDNAVALGADNADAVIGKYLQLYAEWDKRLAEAGDITADQYADMLWNNIYSKVSF